MRAVCLKHVPIEGFGAFATALTARGASPPRPPGDGPDGPAPGRWDPH
jgi:hypothetical protein